MSNTNQRIHLSLTSNLVPVTTTSEVLDGTGGKPKGLWYSFDDLWLDYVRDAKSESESFDPELKSLIEQDSVGDAFPPAYKYAYKLDLDMRDILVISKPETLKLFVQQFEYPPDPEEPGSFLGEHLLPSGRINWQRVAATYKGIEFPFLFGGYGAAWFRGMDVPGGCIWDSSAIKGLNQISFSDLSE